jgi:hypothetical protein
MKAETRANPLAFCHDSILSIAQDLLRCCNACTKSTAIAGSCIIMETIASMSSETTKPANNASYYPIVARQCFLSACYTKRFHAIRLVAHSFFVCGLLSLFFFLQISLKSATPLLWSMIFMTSRAHNSDCAAPSFICKADRTFRLGRL